MAKPNKGHREGKGPGPGPDPERLKIESDWKDAVKKALRKPRPKGGWPRPPEDEGEGKAGKQGQGDDAQEEGQQG
jgi:hypothetical protein